MSVVAYVPDLMDRSKVAAAGDVTFVAAPADLAGTDADLVLVDLGRPGVLDVLPHIAARVVGFANHEREELFDAARAAGAEPLARSVFFRRVGDLVANNP